ncbi:hypothetical protein [Paraburkholderia kururiensis]|jgi:hypothetical protein|uniref:hypothetical protein n=1 Tax=Paraburkholderia kururiensis TaxID=984307 RepID=UPI0018F675BB|nr:hypothetical protein [Paraburkholderia kururiensis]
MKPHPARAPVPAAADPEPGSAPRSAFRFPLPVQDDLPLRRREWPFYLDRRQRARLRWLHEAWGDDAVIQIYCGCVRIRGECGDWRFSDDAQLRTETARRCGYSVLQDAVRAPCTTHARLPPATPGPPPGPDSPIRAEQGAARAQHTTDT